MNTIFQINVNKLKNTVKTPTHFEIGDKVRIEIKKSKLNNRSYTPNVSDTVYEDIKLTDKYAYVKDYPEKVSKSRLLFKNW